jgi:hypothetical protein
LVIIRGWAAESREEKLATDEHGWTQMKKGVDTLMGRGWETPGSQVAKKPGTAPRARAVPFLSQRSKEAKKQRGKRRLFGAEQGLFRGKKEFFTREQELFTEEKEFLPWEQEFFQGEQALCTGEKGLFTGEQALFRGEKGLFRAEKGWFRGKIAPRIVR